GGTGDEVGNEVDADVERHARDRVRLGAAKYRRAPMRDGIGEHHALARDFAPFDVAPLAGEDAHRAREVLILAGGLAVLDDEFLPAGPPPVRFGKNAEVKCTLCARRVREWFCPDRVAHSGTRPRAALEPQLRP